MFLLLPCFWHYLPRKRNQSINFGGLKFDTKARTGVNIGFDMEIPVVSDIYIQPGLLFTSKVMVSSFLDQEIEHRLNYFEIPLSFLYKPMLGGGNLILGFGPYLAYGIGGHKSDKDRNGEDIYFGKNKDYKPFDMGGNLLLGYMLKNGLFAQFKAQIGLKNIAPEDYEGVIIRNNGFGLSVGYRF